MKLTPLLLAITVLACAALAEPPPPNIIFIYGDDVGYGDVSCYGADKIATPQVDRLAGAGLRFTAAYATSATCTPSRYALLTGEYPWRKEEGSHILPAVAPCSIDSKQPTLPFFLQRAGYATAVIGKWHLGLGDGNVNWNEEIKPGPLEIGFDTCFLVPATNDRTPCVYVEDHRVVGLDPRDPITVDYSHRVGPDPIGPEHPELLRYGITYGHAGTIVNGISRVGFMSGGYAARWVDQDMVDTLTTRALRYIEQHKNRPFFLYFSTTDIHVPRLPNARFVGRSGLGLRGDAILQFDDSVGRILNELERLGLAENTLVVLSSDNGPVVDDGYADGSVEQLDGHRPAGGFRGAKYSAFEGGTRVPFIVRWPARIKPGVSDALVSQVDLFGSIAALLGREPAAAGVPQDSRNVLPALLGADKEGRDYVIEHAVNGTLALTQRRWKYIEPNDGPATVTPGPRIETGFLPKPQLYDLRDDPGETRNVAEQHPEKVKEMAALLAREVAIGRTGNWNQLYH